MVLRKHLAQIRNHFQQKPPVKSVNLTLQTSYPTDSRTYTIHLNSYELNEGKHRIIKRLSVMDTEKEEGLADEFTVE